MCHEQWMWRRDRRAEERSRGRDVWLDFERTTPVAEPEAPALPPEPTEAERAEEAVNAGR